MNVATLEAALPALAAAILTDVDDAAQVSVGDGWPTVRRGGMRVRWAFVEEVPAPDVGGLGRLMQGLRYTLLINGPSASQAERRTWAQEVRAGLHHQRPTALLSVTGFDHAQVIGARVSAAPEGVGVPGGTGSALAELDVVFFGDVLTADAA